MSQVPDSSKPRNWPTGVAGVIAFAFGMIVAKIDAPGWAIVIALLGGALSYGVTILVVRLMSK